MSSRLAEAADLIRTAKHVVVVSGAGVSVASGLPMFRGSGPDAIWSNDDLEIATSSYYRRNPSAWWQWFFDRFAMIDQVEPNAAHHALRQLETWKESRGESFVIITQNIDTLHEKAGTENLIKVHGTAGAVRCLRSGCVRGAPSGSILLKELDLSQFGSGRTEHVPLCPACGSIVRPHVLLFDEYYHEHHDYGFARSQAEIEQADLLVFVGTSFSVGITALALDAAYAKPIQMISIDPVVHAPPRALGIEMNAEDALPQIVQECHRQQPGSDDQPISERSSS